MLRGSLDGRQPRLAPLDPDLSFRAKPEGGVVQGADAYFDPIRVAEAAEARAAMWAEAPPVVCRELSGQFERVARPLGVDAEGASGLFSAISAVATADV